MESINYQDIDQDDETPYLLSDGMDAALDRLVDGTFSLYVKNEDTDVIL